MEHEEFDPAKRDADEHELIDVLMATFASHSEARGEGFYMSSCIRALVYVLARHLATIPDLDDYLRAYAESVLNLATYVNCMRKLWEEEKEEGQAD